MTLFSFGIFVLFVAQFLGDGTTSLATKSTKSTKENDKMDMKGTT
jgi:hypothetical protein